MKKIQASNWISAARSVAPQVVPFVPALSAMARPRIAMSVSKAEAYREAAN
ncbi:MAG TPA: hypothetical protein VG839_03655 [Asticcacaulis sp.]|nr:hypothetical protein [Asticcacaulis sp.]